MTSALQASFSGKRILVTGGASGLGRSLVERLCKDNAVVFALDKDASSLEKLKIDFPTVITVCIDLENWDETKAAVEALGPLDHLVNNAGIFRLYPFMSITPQDFQTMFDVNVRSIIAVSQAVAKGMIAAKNGGTIVNISSTAAERTHTAFGLYNCTKASVSILTKNMAFELAPHGIRVNCICPTFMQTAMVSPQMEASLMAPDGFIEKRTLLKRFVKPNEAADLVLFLLSPLSTMITGEAVFIDGGASTC